MAPNPYVSTKNPRSRKSFRQFSETLDVKHKTVVSTFCVAKLNLKTIKKRQFVMVKYHKTPWPTKNKQKCQIIPLSLDST